MLINNIHICLLNVGGECCSAVTNSLLIQFLEKKKIIRKQRHQMLQCYRMSINN